jgi:hypothetical protein
LFPIAQDFIQKIHDEKEWEMIMEKFVVFKKPVNK